MKRLELYLDTSVISHLFAEDTPEKMSDTRALWMDFQKGRYELFLSPLTAHELQQCSEPKRGQMTEMLRLISFSILAETEEIRELANEYVQNGVLREKSLDDCLHIAYAVVNNCDIIVSWNFKHLVNYKTINQIRIVNAINHYKEISIVSPTMLIEEV